MALTFHVSITYKYAGNWNGEIQYCKFLLNYSVCQLLQHRTKEGSHSLKTQNILKKKDCRKLFVL